MVLEDRADPAGPRITLHVAIHRSYSRNPRPDPVVYLEGGPGGAPLVDGFWAYPFVEERDLIVFDQRGTGLTSPSLDCREVTSLLVANELEALRRCRQRLEAEGIRLSAYNSAQSAADLEDLRLTLDYEQWNLYGISYGTRLALTALRDHPVGVRSLVLDSVYPPQVDIYLEMPRNAQRAFDALFAACAADELCEEAYPDLEERFYALVEQLDGSPVNVGGGVLGLGSFSVDGGLLLQYLFQNMYVTEYLGDLPAELADFLAGDWGRLDFWYSIIESAYWANDSEGFHYSVQCSEELPFSDPAALDPGPPLRGPVESAFGPEHMHEICELWDVPPADARENLPVVSDVPVLLLAGTFDPITPPAWALEAAEHLSAAQLIVVPGVGHGVLGSSFCIDDIVLEFLEEPLAAIDDGCLAELDEIEFRLPR
jgi:pimeloyl-ACP methyl ester carboxylesterase